MSKHYLLIQPDEDGNPIRWLSETDVADLEQLMRDHSIERFLNNWPKYSDGSFKTDPNYWEEGDAMLMEAKLLKVKPVEVVKKWKIEDAE